jgi:RNA polymerase sigma-70 factor, ECF subfamily
MAPVGTLVNRFDAQRLQVAPGLAQPGAFGDNGVFSSRQGLIDALKLTARGDQAAFKSVYAATSVKLFGIILRILERQDVAEDVLQEVYIRVWQQAGDFDPASTSPMTWLVTIARNRVLDETRRNTTRSLEDCPEIAELSNHESQLADHEQEENRHRLLASLARLGPDKKAVVVLAYHYGMTSQEIARSTNRSVAAVKTWLRRNLAKIKDCLSP